MTRTIFIAAALALAVTLPAVPANAQVARTYVSAAGSDSNNCANVATPCRHLATAYLATAPNGEIYVLDPANYGSLTITGPVSIEGHGWASIAPPNNNGSGSVAITINANAGDRINIIGVVLDGTNLPLTTGIQFNSGGTLTVRDSVIRNFTANGIWFRPNSSNSSNLYVANALISDNSAGVEYEPTGTGTMTGALSHVDMENNGGVAFAAYSSTQAINVTISDSVVEHNGNGIASTSGAGLLVSVMVFDSTIANNTVGLLANLTGGRIWVTRSAITGNANGWEAMNGGSVASYADNNIAGNNANENAPPSIGYK
jgi:hypothetical protein